MALPVPNVIEATEIYHTATTELSEDGRVRPDESFEFLKQTAADMCRFDVNPDRKGQGRSH